jgi:glycerol kinase
MQWIKNQLELLDDVKKAEELALSVKDNNGVDFIPAFSGLGAPHWKMDLEATIMGLTFGCDKKHVIRAALESIPFQIKDVITAMETDSGIKLKKLNADGGITSNSFIMQFLSDLLNTNVENIGIEEVSALGAAYLAGLESGIFEGLDHISGLDFSSNEFIPQTDANTKIYYEKWQGAIKTLV